MDFLEQCVFFHEVQHAMEVVSARKGAGLCKDSFPVLLPETPDTWHHYAIPMLSFRYDASS